MNKFYKQQMLLKCFYFESFPNKGAVNLMFAIFIHFGYSKQ